VNLVDTSGWIEYFFGEKNAKSFTPPIESTKDLIVPVNCLYEEGYLGSARPLSFVKCFRELMHSGLRPLRSGATVHGPAGDWSIFRPKGSIREKDESRKHGPVPLPAEGDSPP